MRFARGNTKFAAIAATPLLHASAGDSPPLHLHFLLTAMNKVHREVCPIPLLLFLKFSFISIVSIFEVHNV